MLNFFGKGSAFADDNTCAYFVDDADMIAMCMSDQNIYRFDTRKIKSSEFRESLKRKVYQNHIIVVNKISTGIIVCKGRTFTEKV